MFYSPICDKILLSFQEITCIFMETNNTDNLYFPSVYMVELTLKEEMNSPDGLYAKNGDSNIYRKLYCPGSW